MRHAATIRGVSPVGGILLACAFVATAQAQGPVEVPPTRLAAQQGAAAANAGETPKPAEAAAANFHSLEAILGLIEADAKRETAGEKYPSIYNAVKLLVPKYEALAAKGDREALFKLGAMHLEGVGVHPNSGKARYWFARAGGDDHPLAQVALGRACLKRGVDGRGGQELGRTIETLGKLGPAAGDAVPVLTNYLENGWPLGHAAAAALARIGEKGMPVLIAALGNPNVAVRAAAAAGFAETGAVPEAALEPLRTALKDDDPQVRELAERALKRAQAQEQGK
jgi:TPR repeat protein